MKCLFLFFFDQTKKKIFICNIFFFLYIVCSAAKLALNIVTSKCKWNRSQIWSLLLLLRKHMISETDTRTVESATCPKSFSSSFFFVSRLTCICFIVHMRIRRHVCAKSMEGLFFWPRLLHQLTRAIVLNCHHHTSLFLFSFICIDLSAFLTPFQILHLAPRGTHLSIFSLALHLLFFLCWVPLHLGKFSFFCVGVVS